mmetsp:Transcript_30806/g.65537  ORF Transcript_30806/g.65537 Transcript_30806/m.65537 type:complete len:231 (+) Transcript_30806:2553-3245(+)
MRRRNAVRGRHLEYDQQPQLRRRIPDRRPRWRDRHPESRRQRQRRVQRRRAERFGIRGKRGVLALQLPPGQRDWHSRGLRHGVRLRRRSVDGRELRQHAGARPRRRAARGHCIRLQQVQRRRRGRSRHRQQADRRARLGPVEQRQRVRHSQAPGLRRRRSRGFHADEGADAAAHGPTRAAPAHHESDHRLADSFRSGETDDPRRSRLQPRLRVGHPHAPCLPIGSSAVRG